MMKINATETAIVERNGIASDGAFTIQFNAKMAKILSDGLYSDKIQSIIRELTCNAIDSHVEAGKADEPIEVHLPTIFEPWFYVRDFGVGLDHEQVIKIYTCYGASTKTNSNEFIGQLGLGSKSPFSYVDAFDVTARKNGIERQYSMYKNEEGMPSVALLHESSTTEPNGITVKMPVINGDYNRFIDKARQVFRWLSVKPLVTGVSEFSVMPVENMWEGDGWAVRRKSIDSYYNSSANFAVALMGKVAYPIASNSISNLTDVQRAALSLPITLTFDIGELDVAASREALGYNAYTQQNIKNKLDVVVREIGKVFEEKVSNAKTEWEARELFGRIFDRSTGFRHELETIYGKQGLNWRGIVIKNNYIELDTSELWDKSITPGVYSFLGGYKNLRQFTYHDKIAFRCSSQIRIVFDDMPVGGKNRMKYLRECVGPDPDIFYLEPSPLKTVEEVAAMLGNAPYTFTSMLPKKPAEKRERVHMLRFTGYDKAKKAWAPVDIEIDDGGFYVQLSHYDVMDGEQVHSNFESTIQWAQKCGIISSDTVIYAPRYGLKNKVAEHDDWVEFFGWLRNQITQKLSVKVAQIAADSHEYRQFTANMRDKTLWQSHMQLVTANSLFARFRSAMMLLEAKHQQADKNEALVSLALRFGHDTNKVPPSENVHQLWEMIKQVYPMLPLALDRYGYSAYGNNQHVINYINMVDKMTEVSIETAVSDVINA